MRNEKSEIRNRIPEIGNRIPEIGNQKSENWKSEINKSETRSHGPEIVTGIIFISGTMTSMYTTLMSFPEPAHCPQAECLCVCVGGGNGGGGRGGRGGVSFYKQTEPVRASYYFF